MSTINRRTFVKRAIAASTVFHPFVISGTKASGRVIGANDTIRVAVAGINQQGNGHIGNYLKIENVAVTHLIDPDSRLFKSRSQRVEEAGGTPPICLQDPREALEDPSFDVISIATPNHWHSLLTIWACLAGKDVYVEKPLSHNISEGRQCVEVAERYERIVQHGTQQRSSRSRAKEIAAVHSEKYGKLLVSKGYCCKPRWSIGHKPIVSSPTELNYDVWQGPVTELPYHENLVHYNWHWFWETGNGDIGNQGVHELDVARWAVKGATLPHRVWSLGGRLGYEDQGETPNMQMAVFEYDDAKVVFEVRGLVGKETKLKNVIGNEYYTTEGMIKDGKFHPKNGSDPESISGVEGKVAAGGQFGSFINAVRSRKIEDLNANVLDGHYSSAMCHLANISYQLGTPSSMHEIPAKLGDDSLVAETFDNLQQNLRAAKVNLSLTNYVVGESLNFDAETEQFMNSGPANGLLSREYRKPYALQSLG